jgi:hypothetical protein
MGNSDRGQRAAFGLVAGLRGNCKGCRLDFAPGTRTRVVTLGGYHVNGMYYSREDVMVLANGGQQEAPSTK